MHKPIHNLWPLLALILAVPASGPILAADKPEKAAGPDVVVSAGRQGGGYWGIAERLQAVAAESRLKIEVLASEGSIENLNRLADPDNPVNLALTQADALQRYVKRHPDFSGQFKILESIGLECIFIIANAEGDVKSDQDLQDPKGHRIAIGGEQSGVAMTFDYMTDLVPGLSNTKPVYMDTLEAMKQMRTGDADAVDAIMLVHRPKVLSPQINLALDKPSIFQLIPVEDRHLLDELPNGESVYEFLDVPLIRGGIRSGTSVPTVCTKGLLLSSLSKLDGAVNAKIKRIIDFQWMRVYPVDL